MPSCKVHNVRFYKPEPRAIYCMAIQQEQKKIAVSRSDASLEIWNISHVPFIERTIAPNIENYSIEGLAWCDGRLFSVGLHGLLVEYDLAQLTTKNSLVLTGEAAFCLDVNKTNSQIAIGTENGYLNIFNVTEEGASFSKFLDKQEGRILCLKYDASGEFVVSGGIDAIRIWSIATGHAIHKLTTSRAEANKPTIIWCLAITNDFTIISGDSRGKLTFWDGKVGAQVESYQSHRADVLSVCLSEDQTSLFCAGIDPNIINYVKINVKDGNEKWVKSVHRKIHEHDVRALVLCDNKLYSSGVDGYLACSYQPPRTLLKYPPILQGSIATVSKKGRFCMLRYPKHVDIWSLGEGDESFQDGDILPLKQDPKKLVTIQKLKKSFDGEEKPEGIIFSTISNDGNWICYGTKYGMRIFQFSIDAETNKPNMLIVQISANQEEAFLQAIFTPKGSQLIAATSKSQIKILNITIDCATVAQTLEPNGITDTVSHLSISENGKFLVAADLQSNIVAWTLKNKKWEFYCKLPKYAVPPTALAIHPNSQVLVIVYADNKIVEYSLKNREFTEFSKMLTKNVPKQWISRQYPIKNVTFSPQDDNAIVLHDDSTIFVIDKNKFTSASPKKQNKKAKLNASEEEGMKVLSFNSVKKYKHLVHLEWISKDEMLAVEVNPLSLFEQLPPCLIQNKFGTK